MEHVKSIIIGICIFLGLAIIGLSNRYEVYTTDFIPIKIDKFSGKTYILSKGDKIYKWIKIRHGVIIGPKLPEGRNDEKDR